jgi:hypothetical protein
MVKLNFQTYFNGCEDSTFFLIEDKPHPKIEVEFKLLN